MLSTADRASLKDLATAPSTTQGLALRARIVLLSEQQSTAAVSRELDVSPNTVLKWKDRFAALGVPGLDDRSRSGRPRSIQGDAHQAVLRLQLREPTGRAWTTRAVAAELGMSQTAVSRLRRQWFSERRGLIARSVLGSSRHVLAGVFVSPTVRALVIHEPATADPIGTQSGPYRLVKEAVRTVLSGQLAFHADDGAASDRSALLDMLAQVEKVSPADRKMITLIDVPVSTDLRRWSHRHPRCSFYHVAPVRWMAQLDAISEALDRRQSHQLCELERQMRVWADRGATSAFRWIRPSRLQSAPKPTEDGVTRIGPPRLASMVVRELRESIATGAFPAGQRIAEEPLAARLGVSRGPIRDALQILAEDGLLALEPHRGAYVPVPTYQDIFDTYTARAPLGALLFRRVATTDDADLAPVSAALQDVVRFAEAGDAPGAGHADIQWQNAAAAAARMPRIEKLFVRLSLQLRMFVSILGLDYAYSVEEIVLDDRAIFDALQAHDADLVTTLWTRKIDNAVHNMVEQYRRLQGGGDDPRYA
jgi:DNA-binding GntR family transcriptional regulator/transposase